MSLPMPPYAPPIVGPYADASLGRVAWTCRSYPSQPQGPPPQYGRPSQAPYPTQQAPYPTQQAHYPTQQAPYPAQSYPPQASYSFKAPAAPPPVAAGASSASRPSYHASASAQESGEHPLPARPVPPTAVDKPTFRDVWALVLFLANVGTFIGVSVAALVSPATVAPFMPQALLIQWVYALLVVAAVSVVAGGLYTLLMRYATRVMIIISVVLSVCLMILYAVYCFIYIAIWVGVLFLLFALFYAFVLFSWRHRIPFAVILVTTVLDTMVSFPASIFVSFFAILLSVGVSVLCTFVLIYMFNVWVGAALICLCVYYVFGFYWISQARRRWGT